MTWSVVILSARAANLVPCVQALRRHEPDLPPDRLLVVDDGARADAEPQLAPLRWLNGVRPFVFARNANLGLRAAAGDVILLNDDAELLTPRGFSQWAERLQRHPEIGVCSAAIRGVVGNPRQHPASPPRLRYEADTLAFVCVYLPRRVLDALGDLDERFTGYGFEDNDYCRRARHAGLRLGIWDGCVLDHGGRLPSTFRTRPDLNALFQRNRRLYQEPPPPASAVAPAPAPRVAPSSPSSHARVDLLYLACNRLEFTRETFGALVANTDWPLVRELVVLDDGSVDGTWEWLQAQAPQVPAPVRCVRTRFGSPVAAMVHFIESSQAPVLAKVDNDAMMPPGWLAQSLDVLDRHPELALLGIEAMVPTGPAPADGRGYQRADFISGLGLYRRSAFGRTRPRPLNKYFGLEEWQMAQRGRLVCGWIQPALPVFLLDRLPFEPWTGLSADYLARRWQRPWPGYDPASALWHWRWPESAGQAPAVPPPPLAPAVAAAQAGPPGPHIVAALRVKNEAAHLEEVLASLAPLCRQVFVFDDHSTDGTAALAQSFGALCTVVPSPFSGLDEARDKNHLLRLVGASGAEWVLWIDGDEVLERSGPAALRAAAVAGQPTVAAYSLRIAYLWDAASQVRVDGIYGRFTRPSFFRLRGQRLAALQFAASGFGGNLHCGNIPRGLQGAVRPLPVRLKHYGYLRPEERRRKYDWYNAVDPNNHLEDRYRHIAGIPGARHAPGPLQLQPWTE